MCVREYRGEQRALHHLREVDQREHGTVEVGEVRTEDGSLFVGEVLRGVHAHSLASSRLQRARRTVRAGDGIGATPDQRGPFAGIHTTIRKASGITSTVTRVAAGADTPSISRPTPCLAARLACDHVDPPSGGLGDVGMREVHALREPAADPGSLAPGHRVDLHLGPPVAGVAPGDDVLAPQVLTAGDHDRGGRAVVDHPAVDLDPQSGALGEPAGAGRVAVPTTTMFTANSRDRRR